MLLPNIALDTTRSVMGVIGAGNYATRMLIPALKQAGAQLHTIATPGGLSSAITGGGSGFLAASSDVSAVLASPEINAVAIVTRHDSHASLVSEALFAGKHVFVEKPLALNFDELEQVESAYRQAVQTLGGRQLMRSGEHTSELQSLMRISYAVFCLKKKNQTDQSTQS